MPQSSKQKRGKRIQDLPASMRPREKLLAKGAENLTDSELFAILLRSGSGKQNAVMLAETLLRHYPSRTLQTIAINDLAKIPGIGHVKAIEILAALEIGRRVFAPSSMTKVVIRTTADALTQLRDIAEKKQEHLIAMYLNARHEMIAKEVLGIGSVNTAVIEPREIFRPAFTSPCVGVLLAHNHPSGDPAPSDDDIRFTSRIQKAGELMGIMLLDHIIISKTGYFSFSEGEKEK